MEWFKVKTSFFIHKKLHKLRVAVGQDYAEVYFFRLLYWLAAQDSLDGALDPDPAFVEGVAGWKGEPGVLVEALCKTGFLDKGYAIHGWDEHNGKDIKASLAKRDYQAERRRARIGGEVRQVPSDDLDGTEDPAKPKPPPKPRVPTEAAKLVEKFQHLHVMKRKAPYAPVWKRDAAILSALVAEVGPSEVAGRMERFFEIQGDKWLQKVGYDVPAFKGQFNRLAKSAEAPGHPVNPVRTI